MMEAPLIELKELMFEINRRYKLTPRQMFEIAETKEPELFIPLILFSNRRLGVLETVVKYMKENLNMSFNQIARFLHRDNRTIWSTYDHAKKKEIYRFIIKESRYLIPLKIFADREKGVLEALANYCKEKLSLTNAQIAQIINRDNRTIWSVVNRKRGVVVG